MNRHASGSPKVLLIVDDPVLARAPITGLFRADSSEAFVRLLEASFKLKAERAGDTITLHRTH
jgi:ferric-dicitrate binding protein FerR (iron transport regulator)